MNSQPEHKERESLGKLAFKQVTGIAIVSAIGAAAFAIGARYGLPIFEKIGCEKPKHAAILGGALSAISTLGTGGTVYDITVGRLEAKKSFAERVSSERAMTQKNAGNYRS